MKHRLATLRPHLISYARAISDSEDAAEDLVQSAMVRALEAKGAPAALADLRPWMFRVIRNLSIDQGRKLKVQAEYFGHQKRLLDSTSAQRSDPLSAIVLQEAFSAMSPDHREVLFLIDIMGMRYDEAAETIGVARGTIMSRVSRARRVMIERLDGSNVAPLKRRQSGI